MTIPYGDLATAKIFATETYGQPTPGGHFIKVVFRRPGDKKTLEAIYWRAGHMPCAPDTLPDFVYVVEPRLVQTTQWARLDCIEPPEPTRERSYDL